MKTDTGRRSIDLDERTIAVLKAWRKRQDDERKLVGPAAYQDKDLVFPRPDGGPTTPTRSPNRSIASWRVPRSHGYDFTT